MKILQKIKASTIRRILETDGKDWQVKDLDITETPQGPWFWLYAKEYYIKNKKLSPGAREYFENLLANGKRVCKVCGGGGFETVVYQFKEEITFGNYSRNLCTRCNGRGWVEPK